MSAIGWKIDEAERLSLLCRFPPIWPDVVADRITLKSGVVENEPLPELQQAAIIGSISDGEGLQVRWFWGQSR